MAIDYDVMMKINRIATGEQFELTRGQVAEQMIDMDAYTRSMIEDKAIRAREYYSKLIIDDTVLMYDVDLLDKDIEDMKKGIAAYLAEDKGASVFERMYNAIESLFVSPPFEGMDSIPYGIGELCVFSVLEYFAVKEKGYDHEDLRRKYKASIAQRTEAGSSDYWIHIFDILQERFEGYSLDQCCTMAIAAMRVQNEEYFDAIRKNAEGMGAATGNGAILKNFIEKNLNR